MKRDEKIEKINAYKKLIETKKLPKASAPGSDKTLDDHILDEFTAWAEAQLAKLLGEDKGEDEAALTEEERLVLKAYAQRLIKQINSVQNGTAKTVAPVKPVNNAQPLRQPVQPVRKQEIGTAQEEEEVDQSQPIGSKLRLKRGQTIEDQLDALDRLGPKF